MVVWRNAGALTPVGSLLVVGLLLAFCTFQNATTLDQYLSFALRPINEAYTAVNTTFTGSTAESLSTVENKDQEEINENSLLSSNNDTTPSIEDHVTTLPSNNNNDGQDNEKAETTPESFSACLIVMDENFRLYEWIAYHYHVLPLRNLVVATDPRAKLSPEPVLQLFRDQLGMDITLWHDEDYAEWEPADANASTDVLKALHLRRQRVMLRKCMQHHKSHNRTWTAMWDVDEYIGYNGWNMTRTNPKNNHTAVSPVDTSEPGSILRYVKQYYTTERCLAVGRITVGSRETPGIANESHLFDMTRFDTVRFRYRSVLGLGGNGLGKCFINVQELPETVTVRTPHRVISEVCPSPWGNAIANVPFKLNHYVGTWEAYSYRDDARKGKDKSYQDYLARAAHDNVHESNHAAWINGFVQQVGLKRATTLLKDAGLDPSYNSSHKIDEFELRGSVQIPRY